MSYSKMRVEIPSNPAEMLSLAKNINQKHIEDGNASPLIAITSNNWVEEGPKIDYCLEKHNEAEAYKAKAEAAYKERDLALEGIGKAVRASRDVLSGVHHENMKRMTDWGFSVTESVKVGPKKTVGGSGNGTPA
jgi:hypothetical protein